MEILKIEDSNNSSYYDEIIKILPQDESIMIIGHFKSKGGQAIRHALKSLVTDKGYYTILVQSNKWHISARRLKCQNCKKLYNIDDFSYNENFDPNNLSIRCNKKWSCDSVYYNECGNGFKLVHSYNAVLITKNKTYSYLPTIQDKSSREKYEYNLNTESQLEYYVESPEEIIKTYIIPENKIITMNIDGDM